MGMTHSRVKALGELPEERYAVIPTDLINDESLSPLARLLGVWLRSRSPQWTTNEAAMCQAMKVKDPKTVRKALRELYDSGWAKMATNRSAEGRAYQYVYMVRRDGRFRTRTEPCAPDLDAWDTGKFSR